MGGVGLVISILSRQGYPNSVAIALVDQSAVRIQELTANTSPPILRSIADSQSINEPGSVIVTCPPGVLSLRPLPYSSIQDCFKLI